jgi:hypothetical protein
MAKLDEIDVIRDKCEVCGKPGFAIRCRSLPFPYVCRCAKHVPHGVPFELVTSETV